MTINDVYSVDVTMKTDESETDVNKNIKYMKSTLNYASKEKSVKSESKKSVSYVLDKIYKGLSTLTLFFKSCRCFRKIRNKCFR